jgi:hypothetical protein
VPAVEEKKQPQAPAVKSDKTTEEVKPADK